MATAKLIGSSTIGCDNWGPGAFPLGKFTALFTGKVSEIKIYARAAGYVKVAIYADSAGEPGALLGANNTGQAVVANQWNTLTISATSITKDTIYWLAACNDTLGAISINYNAGGISRYKVVTYSTFTFPDPAGTGFTVYNYEEAFAGWGVLVVSPSGLSQPISYGTPQLNLTIKPPGHQQAIAYGTPTVQTAGLIIYPTGLEVVIACGTPALLYPQSISPPGPAIPIAYGTPKLILTIKPSGVVQPVAYGTAKLILTIKPSGIAQAIAYGTPALRYPQTVSPPGLAVPIAYGTPSVGIIGIISPQGIAVIISYGTPTILKYVWHVILDGRYSIESPETNRAFVIGRDVYGNPVYGEAHDSDESGLVGERLDFQQELAVPTTAQAGDVAAAVLSKMRLSKKRGDILIPYNCGQELWDVVELTDKGANQEAVKFRVVGLRFEYHPRQARYHHRLVLGAP